MHMLEYLSRSRRRIELKRVPAENFFSFRPRVLITALVINDSALEERHNFYGAALLMCLL